MATSSALLDTTTRHQVYLERLKTGEANQFAAFLQDMDRDIRKRLAGKELTTFSRRRLETLLASVDAALSDVYGQYYDELAGHLIALGEYEAGFEARAITDAVTNYEAVIPAPSQVRAAIFSVPLSVSGPDGGKLLEPFIRDWSATEVKRVTGAIRRGYFEGQTTAQILQVVRGTKANQYRDGLLSISNRNAAAIVRTSVQHVASVARMETWQANDDVVIGYRWVATLDSRTSPICRSLDGRVFKFGKGPRPPAHVNCRSSTLAELDGRYAFLQEGRKRASMHGQVQDQTYYDWLKKQPASFQDDAIGPTRAKLLRDGGLSASQFADLNLGKNFKPLTLAEMRAREPVAFERALGE